MYKTTTYSVVDNSRNVDGGVGRRLDLRADARGSYLRTLTGAY